METSVSLPARLASLSGIVVVVLVAAAVAWNAFESTSPAPARPHAIAQSSVVHASHSARQDGTFYYFIVSSPQEADDLTNMLSSPNADSDALEHSTVNIVNNAQEKADLLHNVQDTNWVRSGQGLDPIVVINLTGF